MRRSRLPCETARRDQQPRPVQAAVRALRDEDDAFIHAARAQPGREQRLRRLRLRPIQKRNRVETAEDLIRSAPGWTWTTLSESRYCSRILARPSSAVYS